LKTVLINRIDTSDVKGDKFELKFFGDFHYGSKQCNVDAIKKEIDIIKKGNAKVILMGDEINVGTKHSVGGGVFDDCIDVQTQYEEIIELLYPIKNKILGIHASNHLQRVFNETSIDLTRNIARELGISYFGFGVFHHIRFGENTYTGYSTHGSSGAALSHTKIKAVVNLSGSFVADFYAMGHLHSLESLTTTYHTINLKDKTLDIRKRYFLLTGSFMNFNGSYAEMKNYSPSKIGCASAFFDKKDWNINLRAD